MAVAQFKDLCMDGGDALAHGRFWHRMLGGRLVDLRDTSARLDPPAGRSKTEVIWLNPVPEPRTGKTRVNLDLRLATPDPAPLLDAGAQMKYPVSADGEGLHLAGGRHACD